MNTHHSLEGMAAAMSRVDRLVRRQVAAAAEVEDAALKLTMMLPPARIVAALEEVARRERVFATINRETLSTVGDPRLAALRSVTDDVIQGRFA